MKELYSFIANKKVQGEERTQNEDGSFTVKTVETLEPRKVFLKKISRRDLEEISLVYKSNYGLAIARGVPTQETLRKSLMDAGGIVSNQDYQRAEVIMLEMDKINKAILAGEAPDELVARLENLALELEAIQNLDRELYNKTAEAYADDRTTLWAALNLTFWDDNKSHVFPGVSFEAKMNFYYQISDDPEDYEYEIGILRKAYNCFYAAILLDESTLSKEYFDVITGEPGTDISRS